MYDNEYPRSDYSGGNYSNSNNNDRDNKEKDNTNNTIDTTYRYSGDPYQDNFYRQNSYSHIPDEPKRKEKKKGGFGKKVLASLSLGVVFGLFAGLGFYAVDLTTGMTSDKAATELPNTPDGLEKAIEETQSVNQSLLSNVSSPIVVTDVTEVAKNVMPSVVSITNVFTEKATFFGQTYENQGSSSGSGIIVGKNDSELLFVSNYHVVENADTLQIQFIDGEQVEASIKGSDSSMDLAVFAVALDDIKESTLSSISIATLGDSATLQVGEPAIAIGNALGYGQSVTTGVISAVDRTIEMSETISGTFIQTDAAINPGNSGGALLNMKGEVIGINSNKIGGSVVEGMGYAIPISVAKPIIEDLMTKETKAKVAENEKGYLGISGYNVTAEVSQMYNMPEGVFVAQVYEGTGAADAGMVKGDIITKFDGTAIATMEELQRQLEYYKVGDTVDITVMQGSPAGYQEKTIIMTLSEKVKTQPEENQTMQQIPMQP